MIKDYDFSCWVIKYGCSSIDGKIYRKDSLINNDKIVVPLCWNHRHFEPDSVLGRAFLEESEDGIYAYCKLHDTSVKETVEQLLRNRGSVSLSPYINKVKREGKYIINGLIREVSLVPERIDPDEAYYPILREE